MTGGRRRSSPVSAGKALEHLLEGLGLKQRLAERELLEAWPQVVGDKIASQSRVVDIEDGVLTIEADQAAWRQELTLLIPEIKAKYNEMYGAGTVKEIHWDRRRPRRRTDNGS
jgi:predicted nucleic acid-binding Zn ribbon protein